MNNNSSSESKGMLWTGRILSSLIVLFLVFDCVGKFMKPPMVTESMTKLGLDPNLTSTLGVVLLVCTLLYAVRQTSIIGAILLCGYFGGSCAIHLRSGGSTFEILFAPMLGVIAWGGLYLRDSRIRDLMPLRKS